jgi:hypothetical protein
MAQLPIPEQPPMCRGRARLAGMTHALALSAPYGLFASTPFRLPYCTCALMIPISLCQVKRPGEEVGNLIHLPLVPLRINTLQESFNLGGDSGGGWTRFTSLQGSRCGSPTSPGRTYCQPTQDVFSASRVPCSGVFGVDNQRACAIYLSVLHLISLAGMRCECSGPVVEYHRGTIVKARAAPGSCQTQVPFCFGAGRTPW